MVGRLTRRKADRDCIYIYIYTRVPITSRGANFQEKAVNRARAQKIVLVATLIEKRTGDNVGT